MKGGYSKNLYGFLRKYIKLPRPSEIWRNIPDKWTPKLMYFYADMALANALSFAMKPVSIFNTIVGVLILFKLNNLPISPLIVMGVVIFFGALVVGHIMIVEGFMKQQAELTNSQSPDLVEMRDNIRKLMKSAEK